MLLTEDLDVLQEAISIARECEIAQVSFFYNIYARDGRLPASLSALDGASYSRLVYHPGGLVEIQINPLLEASYDYGMEPWRDSAIHLERLGTGSLPMPRTAVHDVVSSLERLRPFLVDLREEAETQPIADDSGGGEPTQPQNAAPEPAMDARFAELIEENQRLTHKLEITEKNYDSLSHSTLGALTLKYWKLRRKDA
ncbi:hypothetical protein [Corynebacterium lizhenjunii]|uniref:hypothetical protein n=1 Tax=Corynebacterium lizhenjunii TaxID=2709394 RepID=UPI0013EE07D1|nr:hypothetical protein [Corynebacterium lizhenjunii]